MGTRGIELLRVTRLGVVGFALLWFTALAACGGNDGDKEQSLSAPEFRQRAAAICEKAGSQLAALRQPDGLTSLALFSREIGPDHRGGRQQLRPKPSSCARGRLGRVHRQRR